MLVIFIECISPYFLKWVYSVLVVIWFWRFEICKFEEFVVLLLLCGCFGYELGLVLFVLLSCDDDNDDDDEL